ncbi:MAG: exodeoxyribonuclease VII large subunit [Ignavibacteria bacterium]|jgi:exodeoxyribonuclease VII large subunit
MSGLENILTVTELNSKIKFLLEENFRYVNLIGEISNFKVHSQSGHFYFTLKDENSQIQAVMWKTRNQSLLFTPEDGIQVVVKGRINVFAGRGTYQIEVWELNPQGAGELQLRFEKLKQKLFEEGLFDESKKKPIPPYPQNAAIITSRTGAALQDFIKIVKRRFPVLNLFLYPVTVQGITAPSNIITALKDIEKMIRSKMLPLIDVLILTRGGGSLEDLMPFNDEGLARVIYAYKIPVVSAIGHEIDFTICDFVADLRAPTPSAAAELITPDINDLIDSLSKFSYFYNNYVKNRVSSLYNSVKEIENNYYFNHPKDVIYNYYQKLDEMSRLMPNLAISKITDLKNKIHYYKKTLYHISPVNNLKKGYALVYKNVDGQSEGQLSFSLDFSKLVTRAQQIKRGEDVQIKFHDNKKSAKITD